MRQSIYNAIILVTVQNDLIYQRELSHVETNSTKPSQAHRLERQTTNAKIMSNANICENRNVNQDDSIHFNLKKKYDRERNAPNHAKQERNRQIADNPNIGILGNLK